MIIDVYDNKHNPPPPSSHPELFSKLEFINYVPRIVLEVRNGPGRCDIVIPIFILKSRSSTFLSANCALSQYQPGRKNVRCDGDKATLHSLSG